MQYDLNFWQEPDWQRESSVDPNFLMVVSLCVLVFACSVLLMFNLWSVQARRAELTELSYAIEKCLPAAQEVERQRDCLRLWRRALDVLAAQSQRRILWCRQLAALQSLVPDSITLSRVSLDSFDVKGEAGDTGSARVPEGRQNVTVTRYTMTIAGVARGENAEKSITIFSRALPSQPEMSPCLASVELTSVVPEAQANERPGSSGKEFVIVCRYKPVRMDYADN